MTIRPRRSVLYMPGSNERALEKAKSLPADGLILDLEDAVAPDAKEDARAAVCSAVAAEGYGRREVLVRTNGFDTVWGRADLEAAAKAGPDGVLIPKVNTAEDVEAASKALDEAGAADSVTLWVMMETPLAIFNAREIAESSDWTRLAGLVMGTNDLAKEMHGQLEKGRMPFIGMLATCVLAARGYGLAVLDGVFNDLGDDRGFAEECRSGREIGFDGKTLIHPGQIEACNRVFAPSNDELQRAKRIVAAFEEPENQDKGVIRVDGQMVELLHADIARRTVAIADAIATMTD